MLPDLRLLTRKSCLVPTLRGWLCLAFTGTLLFVLVMFNLGSFLSPVQPSGAKILVVEGWLPDYALDSAAALFRRHSYRRIVVTGGHLELGSHLKGFKNYADLGAATLISIGVPDSVIVAVPAPMSHRDRTWVSARALKPWLIERDVESFDVCSLGAHGRRTKILFQKAAGTAIRVGVHSIGDAGYRAGRWWATSQGFRVVVGELIAYLYVKLLFRP